MLDSFLNTATLTYFYREGDAHKDHILIFLHGFPDNAYVWKKQWEELSDYSILVPFMPGTFRMAPYKNTDYEMPYLVGHLNKIIDSLPEARRKKITLVGHDLGGAVVDAMTKKRSDLTSLIFINSVSSKQFFSRLNNPLQIFRSSYMFLFQVPLINRQNLEKFYAPLKKIAAKLGRPVLPDVDPYLDASTLAGFDFYRQMGKKIRLKGKPSSKGSRRIDLPTLFIWGTKDPFLLEPTGRELNKFFKNAVLRTLKAGHWPFLEKPQEINQLIRQFMGS